jgi:hypothetical protein
VAYDFPNHIGLLLFSNEIEYKCALTPLYERFRQEVDDAEKEGDTALYDAVNSACDKLTEWRKKYATAKLRILCLSDGKVRIHLCCFCCLCVYLCPFFVFSKLKREMNGTLIVDLMI